MRSVFRIFAVLALVLSASLAHAAGPVLFDCQEVLLIQGEYYTQPLTINLDRIICMKAGKVAGERVTQIRLAEYIPNQFVWMVIEGDLADNRDQMRNTIAGQANLSGIKPLPLGLSQAESRSMRSATEIPEGAVPFSGKRESPEG